MSKDIIKNSVSINKAEWDYTEHAPYYKYRPNYAGEAIDLMLEHAGYDELKLCADVGAGTGNLTVMLLERHVKTIAIEPNAQMRNIGIDVTKGEDVEWRVGTGEDTTLDDNTVDLFAMGSSFNTTDRKATLREAARVTKPGGWFTCMWNHRDLNDETQIVSEKILREIIPDYNHGSRRENQKDILKASPNFEKLHFIEVVQKVDQSLGRYIEAWKSVKNTHWDLKTEKGRELFDKVCARLCEELPEELKLTYNTRIWMIQRK